MCKNKKEKLKILIVGSFPNPNSKNIYGGQLTACKTLINSDFSKIFKIITLNSSFFSTPPPNLLKRSFFAVIRIINYSFKIIVNKPKVIIIFVADKLSAIEKGLMIIIAKRLNKSVMIFPRAGALINQYNKNLLFQKYIKYTFSKADIFLCQGFSFREFAIKKLNFDQKDTKIIPNWTAKPEYIAIGKNRNYLGKDDYPRILFLGWLEDFKGIKEILEASYILKKKGYTFRIVMAGDGSKKNYIVEFINKYNLKEFIYLEGWVDDKQKISLLEKSNIFILPSWNEGFPNALIEAMSAGLACIVTKVGMIPDFVEDQKNCLLIQPKNIKAIVYSFEKLFIDHQLRQKIAQNGFLYANLNFRVENGLKLLKEEIKKLSTFF